MYMRRHREQEQKATWSAAGWPYQKGKSLKRKLQQLSQHISSTASSSVTAVNRHTTDEMALLKAMLLPADGESIGMAKQRLRLQLSALSGAPGQGGDQEAERGREDEAQGGEHGQQEQQERQEQQDSIMMTSIWRCCS